MNGSAINQVLLNVPQSGNGSAKNTGNKDTDTADFAQAFQTQQANARAERNQVAERNQSVERSRAAERKRDIADNAAERQNARSTANEKPAQENTPPQQSERSESAAPHGKAVNKPANAAKRKDTENSDAADQQAVATKNTTQQTADSTEQGTPTDASQDKTCQQDVDPAELIEAAGEPMSTELQSSSDKADVSTTALALQHILAGKASDPVAGETIGTPQVADTKAALTAGLAPAATPLELSPDSNKTLTATETSEATGATSAEDKTATTNLLDQLSQTQVDTSVGAIPVGVQSAATEPTAEGAAGGTNNTAISAALTVTSDANTSTTEVTDDVLAKATAALKGDTPASADNKAVASTADATLTASDSSTGSFDKGGLEKMFKSMVQSAMGEAAPRDQAASAPAAQSSTASAGLEYTGRPQEAQGTAGLRNFVVQTSVQTPVGQPQWSQAVGEKVLWLAAQNISSAEINLHPQDLGPVQVKVSVNQDQANVTFTSHHPVVREVLDQNLNRLRDMFSEQGLNLVNVDVSDRSFQRQQGEGKEQQGQGGNAAPETEEETLAAVSVIQSQRLVDHYA